MTRKQTDSEIPPASNEHIVVCGKLAPVDTQVVLWNRKGGLACPNKRGRSQCTQHDPQLNDFPTRPHGAYQIKDAGRALDDLRQAVHQLILHYDVCYTSHHCHQILRESDFKGSHFYLDLDGTIYQTCDLYWKTNTAPADDGRGNERAIHIEMANLSWQALASESDLYQLSKDAYRRQGDRWRLSLPPEWEMKLRSPGFKVFPARNYGNRGYFSRKINGRMVRMWDFTEEQYQALIRLCQGIHHKLPNIELKVPYNPAKKRTPLDRIRNFSTFKGILGHAHVQSGACEGVKRKYDPGSAFDWGRLRREFARKK